MAATPPNVEMEAAKFLHKLIQESTDEPTKLATKLHVILQHMRSSGKENSMPYQVISRAMETVINRHGLDIEALMSSRQPMTSGTQGGDASLSKIAGPSQQTPVEVESKKPLISEDAAKIATFSSKPLQGPSSTGQDIYQGSANQLNSVKSLGSSAGLSGSYESAEPGNPRPMQFSSSYDNQNAANMMHKVPAGKALDHEGGFPNVIPNASNAVQGGISSNVSEFGMLRSEASRDTGKLPAFPSSAVGPSMPFKEHHLKQLRAQCLVFLAFRNNMMPKKLHLEIALGNVFPKEDISNKEQSDQKGSMGPGSSSSGFFSEANLLKEGEKFDPPHGLLEHGDGVRNNIIPRKVEAEMQASEAKEQQTSATKVAHPDTTNTAPGIFAMPDIQGSRHVQAHLPSFPLSERQMVVPKNLNVLENNVKHAGTSHSVEDTTALSTSPASPKYTTSEKWIADCQKRKVAADYNWAVKKKKTEQRISACVEKLKATVSSSEDISAKTKSVIELKKLGLLNLQRRLRNEVLNDFFRPTSTEMDRLKSIKKHRIGRRSKQLERHEQKMKEERQKRIRERQKDFFGEMESHREKLEDVFKYKRERVKGFNKYAREFHKRKERLHREKIDRIQREKINLLKVNDVEGYLRMVQDAKSDRVKQLLKETEKYLQKLGSKLKEAKVISRCFESDMGVDSSDFTIENEDETDQAKHYMESNEKYYLMAHSIKETVAEQPATLIGGKLREYQMNGLRWLLSLYNNHLNGILADEMGLGKTVQVISLLCYLMENKNDNGPFLVVVPSSVLPGWESEINFWAPNINQIVYSGPPEERRKLFKERIVQQKFNVLLTTYEYLMNKHDRPKLSKIHWHYVIIDEGHRIKNASCKLNAELKYYHSSHRLLLTGTPLQNNLEELWALLNFLLPNIFNSSEDFSQWFNKPFESNADSSPEEALLSEEENLLIINRLHQVLRPFVLRRLKHKVENQLPGKIERLVRCEASAYQNLLMRRVEDNLGAFGATKAKSVHNTVVELRNICNHPYLSQLHTEDVHDYMPKHYLPNIIRFCGKLEMLDRLLPKLKATDHRILLFSTMTRLLDVMEDYLYWKQYKYLRLDGHTSGGDRGALINQFNKPGSPYFIFLLSIRAGGVGVNLQAADTVIIFDTDWNPQVDLQAQARAHRIGQKKEVLVLRLETVKTVEEQVRASAEHKLGVANQSITAGFFDNNTSAEDRREYLEALLRECKKEEAAPVLKDDALNELLARSESEIDVFEEIDKKRHEEEQAVWKKLVSEQGGTSSEVMSSLPSRLVTDNDMKSFSEAMKAIEVPKPVAVPGIGGKRKGELGNLDTQHYGRGKRAREVRSYEEQWTEDEFEKLCQVENPNSPNHIELKEQDLPIVKSESGMTTVAEGSGLPKIDSVQSSEDATIQQISDETPSSRRGRGRPKKKSTPIGFPASSLPLPSPAKSVAPIAGQIPQLNVTSPSESGKSTATLTSATNATLAVPPGFQKTADHPPGFQPTATDHPPGFASLTAPPPGYKPITTPPGFQQITPPPPGFQPKITSTPPLVVSQSTPTVISSSQSTPTVPAVSQEISTRTLPVGPVSLPVVSLTSADSQSVIYPSAETTGRGKGRGRARGRGRGRGRGKGRGEINESEVDVPQPRGKKSHNLALGIPGVGEINESDADVPQTRGKKLHSVVLGIPGVKASSPVSKPETVTLVVPSTASQKVNEPLASGSTTVNAATNAPVAATASQKVNEPLASGSTTVNAATKAPAAATASQKVNEPLASGSTIANAATNTPVAATDVTPATVTVSPSDTSKSDIASPVTSVPATSLATATDAGTPKTPVSVPVSSQTATAAVTVPSGSLSVSPNPESKPGRTRARNSQSGTDPPRRRQRKKDDTVDAQEPNSNEPAQKKARLSSGRKPVATRRTLRSEAQKINQDSELAEPSSLNVKEKVSTSADVNVSSKSTDASKVDTSASIQGDKVAGPKDRSVATKSASKAPDVNVLSKSANVSTVDASVSAQAEKVVEPKDSSAGTESVSKTLDVNVSTEGEKVLKPKESSVETGSVSKAHDVNVVSKSADVSSVDTIVSTQAEKLVEPKDSSMATESVPETHDANVLRKSADASAIDTSVTEGEEVVQPTESSVATESVSETQDVNVLSKSDASTVDGSVSTHGEKVVKIKAATENKDKATECRGSENADMDTTDNLVSKNELSAENKPEEKDLALNDADILQTVEAEPSEKVPVEENVVEIVQKVPSPVLQNESKKTEITENASLETEATSSRKLEEISQGKVEHEEKKRVADEPTQEVVDEPGASELTMEVVDVQGADEPAKEVVDEPGANEPTMEVVVEQGADEPAKEVADIQGADELAKEVVDEQVADEPTKEVVDDSNKESSELSATQVEREQPDNAADALMTEANLSDMVEDASQGEAEHTKEEDVSGVVENVIDDLDTDVKASERGMDTSLGESEHEKQELSRSDPSGEIEKVTNDEEKSTVEITSGEEKSTVETTTVLPVVLKEQEDGNADSGTPIETDEKSSEKRLDACLGESGLLDGSGSIKKDVGVHADVGRQSTKELPAAKEETEVSGTIDSAMLVEMEAKPLKEDNDGMHGDTVTETEENTDALPPEQAEANRPERINTESKDETQAEFAKEVENPIEEKSRHAEKEQEPPVEIEEATKEHHVSETLNQEKEGSVSDQIEGSKQDIPTNAGKIEVTSHPSAKADEFDVEENKIDVVPPSVEEQNLVIEVSGGEDGKDPSEVEEQRGEKLETTKVVDSIMECGDSVVAPVADEVEVTKGSSEEGDVIHSSGVEAQKDEIMEVTEANDSTKERGTDVTPMVEPMVEHEIPAKSSMEESDATDSETGMGNSIMEGQAAEKSIEERVTEPSEIVTEDSAMEEQVVERSMEEITDSSETKTEDSTMEDQLAGKQQEPEVDAESSMKEDEPKASTMEEQVVESSMQEIVADPSETKAEDSTMEDQVAGKQQEPEVDTESSMKEDEPKAPTDTGEDVSSIPEQLARKGPEQEISVEASMEEVDAEPSKTVVDDLTVQEVASDKEHDQEVSSEIAMEEEDAKPSKSEPVDLTINEHEAGKMQKEQEVTVVRSVEERESEPSKTLSDDPTNIVVSEKQELDVAAESAMQETEAELSKTGVNDSIMEDQIAGKGQLDQEVAATVTNDSTSTEVGINKEEQVGEQTREQEVPLETSMEESGITLSNAADDPTSTEVGKKTREQEVGEQKQELEEAAAQTFKEDTESTPSRAEADADDSTAKDQVAGNLD